MTDQPSITCPVCNKTSFHPEDIRQGYCGQCHDWTSPAKDGVQIVYPAHDYDEELQWTSELFPHRPTHPDFYRIAAAVKQQDQLSDVGRFGDTITVDPESVGYVAQQRALRALDLLKEADERERLVMIWMDAFLAGRRYEQISEIAQPTVDRLHGNRRTRRARK